MTRDIESPVEHVTFVASVTEAPDLKTKPLHQSQKELETRTDGSVLFSIDVILNHELERDLLGYGEGVTVLSPDHLVEKLRKRLAEYTVNTLKVQTCSHCHHYFVWDGRPLELPMAKSKEKPSLLKRLLSFEK